MHSFVEGFLELLAPHHCIACDELADPVSPFCPACATTLEPSNDPGSVFEYGGAVADAIRRFKYQGRSELGSSLGMLMADAAARAGLEVDAVIPVPLHWRRRRKRGYDQAALLARPIAKALGTPALFRGLRRVRNTTSQVELPFRERQRNVAGAFETRRLRRVDRVLLVDDVRTTGATLHAAAAALCAGGVSEVRTLVLATRVLGGAT